MGRFFTSVFIYTSKPCVKPCTKSVYLCVQMAELSQAIVTFELGSAVAAADHYNIREVHTSADQYTPVIFVLPTELQGPAWDATQGELGEWKD